MSLLCGIPTSSGTASLVVDVLMRRSGWLADCNDGNEGMLGQGQQLMMGGKGSLGGFA